MTLHNCCCLRQAARYICSHIMNTRGPTQTCKNTTSIVTHVVWRFAASNLATGPVAIPTAALMICLSERPRAFATPAGSQHTIATAFGRLRLDGEHTVTNPIWIAFPALVGSVGLVKDHAASHSLVPTPNFESLSMLLRVPPVFAAIVLTVLSLSWSATGLWSFLTVFT